MPQLHSCSCKTLSWNVSYTRRTGRRVGSSRLLDESSRLLVGKRWCTYIATGCTFRASMAIRWLSGIAIDYVQASLVSNATTPTRVQRLCLSAIWLSLYSPAVGGAPEAFPRCRTPLLYGWCTYFPTCSPIQTVVPRVLADCLLSAAMVLGIGGDVDRKELVRVDKSSATELLLRRLLQRLPTVYKVTEASSDHAASYARSLLQPLSLCLEGGIQPNFGTCESKECGCEVVEWGWHTCQSWVGKIWATTELSPAGRARSREERQSDMWRNARAALHLSAVASSDYEDRGSGSNPTGWRLCYGGHRGRPVISGPEWAIRFLDDHYEAQDYVAVADTFTMLSQARNIEHWADSPEFVNAIIFAMQPNRPTRVRHTAFRTAWEVRKAMGSPDGAVQFLLSDFAAALSSAALTDILPAENTSDTDSLDRFLYYDRDLHYLQILYALAQNPDGIWDCHLHDHGHFDRCLSVARLDASEFRMLSPYLVGVVESLEARGAELDFLDDFDQELRSRHLRDAWFDLCYSLGEDSGDIQEHEDVLPALIAFTYRCRDTNVPVSFDNEWVVGVRDNLRKHIPDSPMIGSLEGLIASWPK
ncbi:hypothetical protein BV22DRAFT_442856 [Leucogyrophana mollusca]|uniref:Uncharacterized protein n=1 Tax=Leucogyrophana mollusca TaxID=85980 RepID=A0ACB8BJ72_9AGAM|nr:hypothetical protein BV22DRAFT_442856 [Leucogyrophana mollusca]